MLAKLKSRKFLMAFLSTVIGVLTMFGIDDTTVQMVSSIGLIVIPSITYIITEGCLDAAAIKKITSTIEEVVDVIKPDDNKIEDSRE